MFSKTSILGLVCGLGLVFAVPHEAMAQHFRAQFPVKQSPNIFGPSVSPSFNNVPNFGPANPFFNANFNSNFVTPNYGFYNYNAMPFYSPYYPNSVGTYWPYANFNFPYSYSPYTYTPYAYNPFFGY